MGGSKSKSEEHSLENKDGVKEEKVETKEEQVEKEKEKGKEKERTDDGDEDEDDDEVKVYDNVNTGDFFF